MSYTINPNAKNKWARNAENTMDLSLETDASSVYLDNGRTLEQEIGEGSMVSNVATVDSAVSKVIDGTLDGAYESLVFKGKSLVNLVRSTGTKLFGTSGLGKINRTETSHGMIYETSREDLNTYITIRTGTNSMMKPNTSYTIFFEIVQNTIVKNGQSYKGVTVCGTNDSYFDRGTNQLYHNPNFSLDKGIKKIVVTTDSDISSYDGFGFGFPSISSGEVAQGQTFEIQNIIVVEGDHVNQDILYFEGLCDVKMPVLTTTGKNLLNYSENFEVNSSWYGQSLKTSSVTIVDNKSNLYIKNDTNGVTKGATYSINVPKNTVLNFGYEIIENSENSKIHIFIHDDNKSFLYGERNNTKNFITYNSNSNETLNVSYMIENIGEVVILPFISTATTYEPYKSNILRTSEEVVLRSLPNGVKDTLNLNTGEYVQRIGEVVKNNSTGFILSTGGWENKSNVCTFENFKPEGMKVQEAKDKPTLNCDKIPSNTFTTQWSNSKGIESITQHGGGGIVLSITRDKLLIQDVDGLNTYLQSNPLTIQYELATPITTTIEPLTIPFAYENGHIILESGYEGQSLLPTLEYSTVINKTGQIESVAKTIQRQEKQLTMLEKMLIQNIINLDYNNTLLTLKNEMEEML